MPLRRALRWTLPPLALLGLAAWLASSPAAAPATAGPFRQGPSAPAPAAPPPRVTGPASAASVQGFVQQQNAASSRQRDEFVRAGWTLVDVPPPDPKLVGLDPSLLATREADLRTQIASTTASPGQARNLARIAREASDESTRVAAVEALGRAGDEGQDRLLDLLHTLPDGAPARREIAPLLRPHDLADPRAARLAALLDSRDLDAVERRQVAFTLSLVGLRDRSRLPAAVLDGLSQQARDLLASTTSLATLSPQGARP